MKKKNALAAHYLCAFQMPKKKGCKVLFNILVRNDYFLTSEGAVSHDVLYYQQLSVARYQSKFLC